MPFNNGLRPEGQIATGALITYVLIERAIISGRLTPAAMAIISAAFTLGIQPTGLIAVAALLAGGRPAAAHPGAPWPHARRVAAGAAAAGRGHCDPDRGVRRPDAGNGAGGRPGVRTAIGPSREWYTENLRYYYLDPANRRPARCRAGSASSSPR